MASSAAFSACKPLHFARQKFRRVRGAAGSIAKVLVENSRHQLVGDARSHRRIGIFESDRENDGGIFSSAIRCLKSSCRSTGAILVCFLTNATSSVSDINVRLSGNSLKFVGDRDQIISGHRPLLDDLNALLRRAGNRRADKFSWNLLRLNENLSF